MTIPPRPIMLAMGDQLEPLGEKFWSKVNVKDPQECWEWIGHKSQKGYGLFSISGRKYRANRVALALSLGRELSQDEVARHKCDNPPCCNPNHLIPGSHYDNTLDAVERNKMHKWNGARKGENNPRAKLSDSDVNEIRNSNGVPHKELALKYGVSRPLITLIKSGRQRHD